MNANINNPEYLNEDIILTIKDDKFYLRIQHLELLAKGDEEPESAIALVGKMKILIPLAGLIDKDQEISRLNKEIEKLNKLQQQFSRKLINKKFISGAPDTVIEKEKAKLSLVEQALEDLKVQLNKISSL